MRTIRSSVEIDRIFAQSKRATHRLVVVLVSPTPSGRGPSGRVAFVAGKRIGGAVMRNRAKRVLREAFRAAGGPRPGIDVVLIARRDTPRADAGVLAEAVRDAVARVAVPRDAGGLP